MVDLHPCDLFAVVASDGIWDVLSDKEVVDLVLCGWQSLYQTHPPLEMSSSTGSIGDLDDPHPVTEAKIAETLSALLVQAALARGSADNCTCLVVDLRC